MFFNLFGKRRKPVGKMTDQEVFDRIKPVIVDLLGVYDYEVKLDAHLVCDLSADESDYRELPVLLGKRCNIVIPESDRPEMRRIVRTVQDLVDFIKGDKEKIHQRQHSYFSREVRHILREVLGVGTLQITSSSHLINDFSADAIDFEAIVMALVEKPEFGVPVMVQYMPNAEAECEYGVYCITDAGESFSIATVGDLVRFVERYNEKMIV